VPADRHFERLNRLHDMSADDAAYAVQVGVEQGDDRHAVLGKAAIGGHGAAKSSRADENGL